MQYFSASVFSFVQLEIRQEATWGDGKCMAQESSEDLFEWDSHQVHEAACVSSRGLDSSLTK